MLSVIIPASNEAKYIGPCLDALFSSAPVPGGAEVIVVANGCHDATADNARAMDDMAQAAGWTMTVIELAEGSKPLALNEGDRIAQGEMRAYLDADVLVSSGLCAQLVAALSVARPRYASGRPEIPPAASRITRAYARFWQRLPFARSAAPGFGLFAVNGPGRARWDAFPGVISDDTFVRLHFTSAERIGCPAPYDWPMIEGFWPLVRVRRRQNAGVAEIARLYPALMANEGKAKLAKRELAQMAWHDPLGFSTYAAVSVTVSLLQLLRGEGRDWARGR